MDFDFDPNTDRLEQVIDAVGGGLSASDLADCFNKAFHNPELLRILGPDKSPKLYYAIMARLHARINGGRDVAACLAWLKENRYEFNTQEENENDKPTTRLHAAA